MDKKALFELYSTLEDALDFLRYFSDSPESLDDAVEKQMGVVEEAIGEIQKTEND